MLSARAESGPLSNRLALFPLGASSSPAVRPPRLPHGPGRRAEGSIEDGGWRAAGEEGTLGLIVSRATDIPPSEWTVPQCIRMMRPFRKPFPRLGEALPVGNGPFPTLRERRRTGNASWRTHRG